MAGDLEAAGSDQALNISPVAGGRVSGEAGAVLRDSGFDFHDGFGDVEKREGEGEDASAMGDGGKGGFEREDDGAVVGCDAARREDGARESCEGTLEGGVEEEAVEASPRIGRVGVVGEIAGCWMKLAPDVGEVEVVHEGLQSCAPNKTGVARGEALVAWRVPTIRGGKDSVEIPSEKERAVIEGEEGGEDVAVEI